MEYKVLDQSAYVLLMTINVSLAFVAIVMACVCCKRQIPKNELLGLEGMVKLKNPDEVIITTTIVSKSESQAELNLSTISNADSDKRASTAHRSLPDIPIAEANGDTGSELYETVADKRMLEAQASQNKNSITNLKKQTSVSQHSSISQADDVSSPYSRVKNSPHGYAKVLSAEHPYAQLNAPSTSSSAAATAVSVVTAPNHSNHVASDTINNSESTQDLNAGESQVDIPAASAIAGMISASQDLPYMTPPVATQHFSGDSQDSSKGYTSISVREPLANILAQQPIRQTERNPTRDVNDSHYATVSDDSDETYAAIEDPNNRNNINQATDIYTSGSETYAQIQPMQSVVVSVEINNTSVPSSSYHSIQSINNNVAPSAPINAQNRTSVQVIEHVTPIPPPVDTLRAQMHSRQASSSSNNSSSVGNLGSPKPEKRQANSPLPPTPKSSSTLQAVSTNNLASGRSSVISVIELTGETLEMPNANDTNSPFKKHKSLSPSKDIEGMYAKVMKKNKFAARDSHSPPSQGNSPVLTRKNNNHSIGNATATTTTLALGVTPLDSSAAALMDAQKISISNRSRCNSYGAKDHGYETIPADVNRKSDCYTNFLQKERQQIDVGNASINLENMRLNYTNLKPPNNSVTQPPTTSTIIVNQNVSYQNDKHYETIAGPANSNSSDPGYETLLKPNKGQLDTDNDNEKKSSDYDPNYEVLKGPTDNTNNSAGLSDDGYAKVLEKKSINIDEDDSIDGYSKVKGDDGAEDGYSTIRHHHHHNYASILEAKQADNSKNIDLLPLSASSTPLKPTTTTTLEQKLRPNELPTMLSPTSFTSSSLLNSSSATTTSTMSTFSSRQTPSSSQYESLTGSDTDPNYESVSYIQRNRSSSSNNELNAYEPLNNADYSDTTPPNASQHAILLNVVAPTTTTTETETPNANSSEVIVDDYFQV